jgi:hypothetical protein
MKKRFDLSNPEQLEAAQKEMTQRYADSLAQYFNPRDEILEQLMICKEIKVAYETLEHMDYLVFEIDFKYASIMLRGIYDKAAKDQEEADKKRQVNTPKNAAEARVMNVESLIRQHNL